jgi:hypothetical protein
MEEITNKSFKSAVKGIDPITKGTFVITWASMLTDFDEDDDGVYITRSRAEGEIVISGPNNPLFDAIKEVPLRVQGLVSSVNFGGEKRFIRFNNITSYIIFPSINGVESIKVDVVFEILENLEFLEDIENYKDNNLL